jgi:hypothetical protein
VLTTEQKRAIIRHISFWSTKSIFECVEEVFEVYEKEDDEESRDAMWDEVRDFLGECSQGLEDWFENEHCKHLDR